MMPTDSIGTTVLLHRIEGGTWLTLSPDHDIERHDLNAVCHRVLNRRVPVPDIHDQIYAHDPIGKWVLAALKRAACVQASILGQGEVDDRRKFRSLTSDNMDS